MVHSTKVWKQMESLLLYGVFLYSFSFSLYYTLSDEMIILPTYTLVYFSIYSDSRYGLREVNTFILKLTINMEWLIAALLIFIYFFSHFVIFYFPMTSFLFIVLCYDILGLLFSLLFFWYVLCGCYGATQNILLFFSILSF